MYLIRTREHVNNEQVRSARCETKEECQAWADQTEARLGRDFVVYNVKTGDWVAASTSGRTKLHWF